VKARLRQPMFWIVICEVVVMFALFVVSWRVYEAHRPVASAGAAPPTALAPAARPALPSPPPLALRPSPTASPGGIRPATSFPIDLGRLNHDQADLERSESALLVRIVHACRAYLETVVLPAVRRAERVNSATSAASPQSPAAIRKMP
jgi:hypothetical protein